MKQKTPRIARTVNRDVVKQEEVCTLELSEDKKELTIKPPYDPDFGTAVTVTLRTSEELDVLVHQLKYMRAEMVS